MLGTCSRSETDPNSHCLAWISATLSVAQAETHPHNLKSDLVEPPPLLDLLARQLLLCERPALVRSGSTRASTLAVVKPPAQTVDIRLLQEGGVFVPSHIGRHAWVDVSQALSPRRFLVGCAQGRQGPMTSRQIPLNCLPRPCDCEYSITPLTCHLANQKWPFS